MANSSAVSSGDLATADQYNNLRDDVVSTCAGHLHDGTNGRGDGAFTLQVSGVPLTLENSTDATSSQVLLLRGDNATRADGDEIYMSFNLDDDAGNTHEFARITGEAVDVSNGSEDGQLRFGVSVAGTMTDVFQINSSIAGATSISYEVDAFTIKGEEGGAGVLYLFADQGDDAGDEWKINIADGGVMTFGNDIASAGSYVTHMTLTPHATIASSSVTFPGIVNIDGSIDADVTDVDVASSGDIDLTSTANSACAIYLRANGGTSETIKIHSDQGTSESSIQLLSDAGGVDINAATGKDVDIAGGTINLTSSDNAGSAVYIRANAGTSETIKIHADQGNGEGSIELTSDAGGIDINANAAKDIDLAGGQINLTGSHNTACTIYLRANAGTSETIKIHADQGTAVTEGAASVSLISDAGGVELRSTADLANAINITNDGGTSGTISIYNDQGTSVTEGAESISLLSDAGGVGIRSTANLANAVNVTADGGTSSTIQIYNDQGTAVNEGVASIQLLSDAGGVGIKSGLNAAGAIRLTADAGTSETIMLHADQGNGTGSICLTSDAGGITLNPATFVTVGGNATNAGEIRLFEDTDHGCNYVAIKPGNVTGSYTMTLPTAVAGGDCYVLKSTDAGVLSWAAESSGGITINANSNNNLITATGTANCVQGEANLTFDGSTLTVTGALTVGVDDTGHDVKLFGASAGAFMLYDQSCDLLEIRGATAAGPGLLRLSTGEATVVACDVLGKIEFQAPAECGTDAIVAGANIQAVAQATFSATVNNTDLLFMTGLSGAATEKFRFTANGELGVGGANYGTDGQVLTSGGAGAAVAWEAAGGTLQASLEGYVEDGTKKVLYALGAPRQSAIADNAEVGFGQQFHAHITAGSSIDSLSGGGWVLTTQASDGDQVTLYAGDGKLAAAEDWTIVCRFTNSLVGGNGRFHMGLSAAPENAGPHATNNIISMEASGTTGTAYTDNAGTETTTSFGTVSKAEHTWRIEITGGGTSVAFYMDDALEATHAANITSSTALYLQMSLYANSNEAHVINIYDFFAWRDV
jgi:hypothetical protein